MFSYEARWPRNWIFRIRSAGELYKNGCRGSGPSSQNQPTYTKPTDSSNGSSQAMGSLPYPSSLEKLDCRPTYNLHGEWNRKSEWCQVAAQQLPYENEHSLPHHYVEKALDEGGLYHNFQGRATLLDGISLPTPLRPEVRLLLREKEATFDYLFWAMRTVRADYGLSIICL
jgi:hypothetical protein